MAVKNNGLDRNVKIHSDKELNAINTCKKVIQYYKKYGKYPSAFDSSSNIKKLGQWLQIKRAAKKGKTTTVFYPSLQKLAEEANLPNMFDTVGRELDAVNTCKEVIQYYKKYGKYPCRTDKLQSVRHLGNWLNSFRMAKKGIGHNVFYPSLQKLAEEANLPDMFDNIDREQNALNTCKEIIQYHKKNGRYPSSIDSSSNIKKRGLWLISLRASKKGNITRIFYPSLQKLAEKANLPNMFDNIDNEQNALNTCKEVIQYYKENGKYPSQIHKLQSVKQLGQWLNSLRAAKKGKTRNKFYPSLQKLAEKANLPNMFDTIGREQNALNICKEVIKYYKENGKYPSLAVWLSSLRAAKKGNGHYVFYPSLQKLAEKANLPDMFNSRTANI